LIADLNHTLVLVWQEVRGRTGKYTELDALQGVILFHTSTASWAQACGYYNMEFLICCLLVIASWPF